MSPLGSVRSGPAASDGKAVGVARGAMEDVGTAGLAYRRKAAGKPLNHGEEEHKSGDQPLRLVSQSIPRARIRI